MTGDQIAQIAYLGLLGAALAGWFLTQNTQKLGKTMQQAAAWTLIFLGAIAVAGLWQDIRGDLNPRQSVLSEGRIAVPQSFDGHYYLTLELNGVPVEFVVDTGASDMVLTRGDAEAIGIDTAGLDFIGSALTANGQVRTAPVWLEEVRLGQMVDRDVRAVVNDGDLFGSLLGMGYLRRFESIEIRDGELILTR